MPNTEKYTCPRCHTGVLALKPVTLYTKVGSEWVIVPNFPAWVCDVCRYTEYDEKALGMLNAFLSAERSPRHNARRRPPRTPTAPRPQQSEEQK